MENSRIGQAWPVLDRGWVKLADVMGSDRTVCDRARGTVGGEGVKRSSDRDLIRLMMRHHHGSSFEFPEVDLQLCVPFLVWRQQIRHRAGNILDEMTMWDEPSVNELSGRYSVLPEIVQATYPGQWRRQSGANRQGSGGNFPPEMGAAFSAWEDETTRAAVKAYENLIANGVAREQARKVWPMGGYTIGFMKMDLRNWLHWLDLRLAPDAQHEIREYARVIAREVIEPLFPITYEAYRDYRLEATTLSRLDALALARLATRFPIPAGHPDVSAVLGEVFPNAREASEFRAKLIQLGLLFGEPVVTPGG